MGFKVGDQVRLITEQSAGETGEVFTIFSIDNDGYLCKTATLGAWPHCVERVNRAEDLYPNDKTVEIDEKTGHLTYVNMPKTEEGVKFDSNKLPYDLLSVCATEEMLKVLAFGKNKYSANNWRKGFLWSRLLGAAARHLFAFMRGEDRDPETGCLHTAHLMCCAMFLTEHHLRNLGTDDRFKE